MFKHRGQSWPTNTGEKTVAQRIWSDFQKAIFKFVKAGEGNAIIEAVAGSGKTTTIVEAMNMVEGSAIFLAFNKAIATELKDRGVDARTFHSLCLQPVVKAKPGRKVENDKSRKIFREMFTESKFQEMYLGFTCRLVGLAKQNGLDCLRQASHENFMSIVEHHEMELDHDEALIEVAVDAAMKLLNACNTHPNMIDFDDMLYLAVRDGIKLPKFRNVFVDEAQDTNAIQRAILKKIMRKDGARLIAVGDPAQAIYGFRGADSDSLNKIAEEFQCTRLPLSVSYRCPQAVVNHARRWVSHIEPSPTAPMGEVMNSGDIWDHNVFGAQDMVVCRTTKPLIELGYRLLKGKKPFYIMGRDIGQNLINLIEKQKARDIETLCERLNKWMSRETEKAIAKDNQAKVEAITDKYDALMALISNLPENDRSVAELKRVIDLLFAEKKNATVLCTIHKSKGLEANTVFWLNSSQCPAKWAKGWQFKQEENLCYVATTRAKNRLVLIEERRTV